METKGSKNVPVTTVKVTPITEDPVVYAAIKGSLHAEDCSAFGLKREEINVLLGKFPGSAPFSYVVNGITINTNVLQAINAMAQFGYKVVSSTGEAEITWTLQREI